MLHPCLGQEFNHRLRRSAITDGQSRFEQDAPVLRLALRHPVRLSETQRVLRPPKQIKSESRFIALMETFSPQTARRKPIPKLADLVREIPGLEPLLRQCEP